MEEKKEQDAKETQLSKLLDEDDIDEAVLDDVLENVPPEQRKVIKRLMISSSVHMRSVASPEADVMKKLTANHITQFLDSAQQEMEKDYAEKLHRKIFTFATMIAAMLFIVVIILLLKDIPDMMEKIIYTVGGVVLGAFGGYGFGKKQNDE